MTERIKSIPGELKDFLDNRVKLYNRIEFIEEDPISIPHLFSRPENIEISGFLTANISWGQRGQIIKNAYKLMRLMDDNPFLFLKESGNHDLARFNHFYYRTFNSRDCIYFIERLRSIYREGESIGSFFQRGFYQTGNLKDTIVYFRNIFFDGHDPGRSSKHLSHPGKGSSGKRINMYLRWMVRNDNKGVDFGLWKDIPASALYIPLDTHSGKVARKLGLLRRKSNDWKAVEELTANLRLLDPADPVKYDFALFGLGIFEKF